MDLIISSILNSSLCMLHPEEICSDIIHCPLNLSLWVVLLIIVLLPPSIHPSFPRLTIFPAFNFPLQYHFEILCLPILFKCPNHHSRLSSTRITSIMLCWIFILIFCRPSFSNNNNNNDNNNNNNNNNNNVLIIPWLH